jgi:hypothetical protein
MTLGKFSLGFAAVALMAAPVVAQSNFAPAVAPLSGDEAGQDDGGIVALSGEDDPLSP